LHDPGSREKPIPYARSAARRVRALQRRHAAAQRRERRAEHRVAVRLAPAGRAKPVRLRTLRDLFDRPRWPTVPRCYLVRLQSGPPGTPLDRPACTRAREVFSECAEDHPRRFPNRYRAAGRAASGQGFPINRSPYAAQRPAPPRPVRRLRFL